jgi:hypothetical protein
MSIKSEQAEARAAKRAYAIAMAKTQLEMLPVNADMNNPQTESKYASHAALDRVLRPIYTANGFSVSFNTTDSAKPDHVKVLCDVTHVEGHERQFSLDVPADGKGAEGIDVMTKTHAAVSAVSVGIRALLRMVFNIVIERHQDDDGNAAGQRPAANDAAPPAPGAISHAQAAEIRAELGRRVVVPAAFLQWAGVSRIADIPAEKFDSCMRAIGNFKLRAAA